jgi:hypothetical protein
MSGVIEVEGSGKPAINPKLGVIEQNASLRRAMKDFPPLVWFTSMIDIPNCLLNVGMISINRTTGERIDLSSQLDFGTQKDFANLQALNRIALGFRIADIPVKRWREHPGYKTSEGAELNESARECGDDPDDWYVSETKIDLLKTVEAWTSKKIMRPKLTRADWYVADIHKMVSLCRSKPGTFIPPSWLKPEEAQLLAQQMRLKVANLAN